MHELPYARFIEIVETIIEQKREEYLQQKERDLFKGWLNYISQPSFSKKDKKKGFKDYVKSLGFKKIAEKYVKMEKSQIEEEKKRAYENEKKVIELFKKEQEG